MIHIDIKKLGRFSQVGHRITSDPQKGKSRGAGWEFVHVCIDDASRIAFSQILPDEKKESAIAFLRAAVAYYAGLGVTMARVMSDHGSCYNRGSSPKPAALRFQAQGESVQCSDSQNSGVNMRAFDAIGRTAARGLSVKL